MGVEVARGPCRWEGPGPRCPLSRLDRCNDTSAVLSSQRRPGVPLSPAGPLLLVT